MARKTISLKKDNYIIFSILIFSLLFHLFGCFYLYDFSNDEGGWLINAKNKVLFDRFSLEGVYYTALSPLNTFLHIPLFKLFGPSIWLGRYVSIVFALGAILLFFLFVRKHYSLKVASIAALIISANGVFNRFTTFAFLESKVIFFEVLSLFFCFSDKKWVRMLAFVPFAISVSFKPRC